MTLPHPPDTRFRPSVTVAAVIHRPGPGGGPTEYLLVQEETAEGLRLNNPAGHLEPGESPLEGALREALEETTRVFTPEGWLGCYLSRFQRGSGRGPGGAALEDVTYLRFAFAGTAGEPVPGRTLDTGIVATLWLTREAIRARQDEHRSPLVMRCIDDHAAGRLLPLEALYVDPSIWQPEQRP